MARAKEKLGMCHTHATKDPDPFHQLYEQRKEKRQGSTIKDLDKIEVPLPFTFNPFDPDLPPEALGQGTRLFAAAGKGNNHKGGQWHQVMERLAGFGQGLDTSLASSSVGGSGKEEGEEEEDAVFKEVSVSMETERWLGFQWGPEDEEGVLGLSGADTEQLQEKLLNLRAELRKLNEPGTRLVFKNPEDYLARKRAREEEKDKDRSRFQRRSVTDRRSLGDIVGDVSGIGVRDRNPRNRHSYTERNDQVSQAVWEYRLKRQSLHRADSADSSASSSPRETRRTLADPARIRLTSDPSSEEASRSQTSREILENRLAQLGELTEQATRSAPASQQRAREEKSGATGAEQVCNSSVKEESRGQLVLDYPAGRVSEHQLSKAEVEQEQKAPEQWPGLADVHQSSQASFVVKQTIPTVGKEPRHQRDNVKKLFNQTAVDIVKSQNSSNKQQTEQPDPVAESTNCVSQSELSVLVSANTVQQSVDTDSVSTDSVSRSAEPVPKSDDQVQSPTNPDSSLGISQTRPSSKKIRAPPPPPAGSAPSATSPPVRQNLSVKQGPPSAAAEVQITCSTVITVQSPPVSTQSHLPERPVRPKRRKELGSAGSNPSSPRDVPQQAPLLEHRGSQNSAVPSVTDTSVQLLQLTENICLEEEAPPTRGTIVLTGKKDTSQKSSSKKPISSSALNAVPPLLLNGTGQTSATSSTQGESSDPARQKHRKGKAPEPPSSSAGNSPRDEPQSASSTPSPSASPRDAPSLTQPAEDAGVREAGVKAERRKSSKAKAPPPPEQQQSDQEPRTVHQEFATSVCLGSQESKPTRTDTSAASALSKKSLIPQTAQVSAKSSLITKERDIALDELGDSATADIEARLAREEIITSDAAILPDSDQRGRNSETSSICESDAESLPPPLPTSTPPPLLTLPPPSPVLSRVAVEEVIEVREVTSTLHTLPRQARREEEMVEEGLLVEFDSLLPDTLPETQEDPQKSMADLRAEFFGLNSTGQSNNSNNRGLLDMDIDELEQQSADSDVSSDERGVEGTFSLGDSGVVLTSLPTSPDDSDSPVQLISYTTTTTTVNQPTASDTHTPIITTDNILETSSSLPSYSSQRPQTLDVNESLATPSENMLFPTSSQHLMSAQDMAALSPRSREIFEKARHFAEMVQPKPPSTKREDSEGLGGVENDEREEFNQHTWQDLEMERRAVISQSTPVKKKGVGLMTPPPTPAESTMPMATVSWSKEEEEEEEVGVFEVEAVVEEWRPAEKNPSLGSPVETFHEEVKEPSASPTEEQSSLPLSSNYSPDRATSPADSGWQGKDSLRINLYSENVLQEPESTEVVDRESIANLASTRGKWEAIFTAEPREDVPPKPKKAVPKWQVRMPYTEKPNVGPDTVSSNNLPSEEPDSPRPEDKPTSGTDMESAIEREIRLAMERENMLRREQEQRLRQLSQQAAAGVKVSSSMESSTESELQPSYHELAEADRGSQFFLNHNASTTQHEDAEGEDALQKGYSLQQKVRADVGGTESIIEREIRLQREREAELAMQRGGHVVTPAVTAQPPAPQEPPQFQAGENGVEVVVEEIPYEEAISRYNHDGESRIAQELRELREREEEVRLLRDRINKASITAHRSSSPSPAEKPAAKQPSVPATHQTGNKSSPSTPRMDKINISISHSIHNSPQLDSHTTTTSSPKPPKAKQETPIEREIRLARERENELRRAKGLPELHPEPKKQESLEDEGDREDVVLTPRHLLCTPTQPDSTMRRFASNRLQQEMLVQRDREQKLRQEGKIISTSEEHILPQKYMEVVGHDPTDSVGIVKRNFKTPARGNINASQDSNASGENTARTQTAMTPVTPREGVTGSGKKSTAGIGAVSFSYREFAQTAESKIERELREMRDREEELRKLRNGGAES